MSKILRRAYYLLEPLGESFVSLLIYIFKYRKFKAVPFVARGFEDHRLPAPTLDIGYTDIIKRLVESYNRAKAEQKNISRPYRVGHMWQEIINTDFNQLSTVFHNNDYEKVNILLENFNREVCSSKMGGGYDCFYRMRKVPLC